LFIKNIRRVFEVKVITNDIFCLGSVNLRNFVLIEDMELS